MSEQNFLKEFFGKMSGKQLFTLLILLILVVPMTIRPELITAFAPLTQKITYSAIDEWNDQGIGGSPYQTWKPYDRGIVWVNVSGTVYYCHMDGETGKLSDSTSYSTNHTLVEEWAIGNVTAGTVYLKETQHNSDLTVPEDIMVIEQLDGTQKQYINSADSQGSPYTISPDGTNYFAQDGALSYINSWTSTNATEVWENVRDNGLTSGRNYKEKVVWIGNFELVDYIMVNNFTICDFSQANITGTVWGTSELIRVGPLTNPSGAVPSGYTHDVEIIGGHYSETSDAKEAGHASYDNAIGIAWSYNVLVRNIVANDVGGSAVTVQGGGYDITIENSIALNCGNDGDVKYSGFYFAGDASSDPIHRISLINPISRNSGRFGIEFVGSIGGGLGNCTVINPTIISSALSGLTIRYNAHCVKVVGGLTKDNTQHGIELDTASSNTILNMQIDSNILMGIEIYRSQYNTISSSIFNDAPTYYGIRLRDDAGTASTDNILTGNTFIAGASWAIVEQDSSDYNLISDNNARGQTYGISVLGGNTTVNQCFNGTAGWVGSYP